MILLPNVDIRKASPQILLAMNVMDSIIRTQLTCELVVTSCGDGKHGEGSKHYPDKVTGWVNAFDARIRDYDGVDVDITEKDIFYAEKIVAEMKKRLDTQYDIVLESNHIHVEFDPK